MQVGTTPGAAKAKRELLGSLEIGRFVAASIVALTHFLGELERYNNGTPDHFILAIKPPAPFAVTYFFVLSGFVMMAAHRRDFGRWGAVPHFWWRRACRIYPMYWLALGLVALIIDSAMPAQRIFNLVSLWPVPSPEFVSPAWSLRYEMAFYIMFGLCLMPYAGRLLLAVWVFSVFWLWRPAFMQGFLLCKPTILLGPFSAHVPAFFSPFEFYFFMGLAAGMFRPSSRLLGWGALAAGIIILIVLGPQYGWGSLYGAPMISAGTGAGVGAVIFGCAILERAGVFRFGPWARKLGAVSYPLYIMHTALMFAFSYYVFGKWSAQGVYLYLFGAAYLAGIFAISAAAAFLLDQPLQRGLRKLRLPPWRLGRQLKPD